MEKVKVSVIESKAEYDPKSILSKDKIRVDAYCRVSTMSDEQETSMINQKIYYKDYIEKKPEWVLVDIYSDYLKIHYFLTNDTPLEKLFVDMEPISEELWNLFSGFYNAEMEFPKLLEAGIILYYLENVIAVPLHPLCKELIVHYAINHNFKGDYTSILICRQLYRYNNSRKPFEDYLRSFLQVLFHAAFAKGSLFMSIQDTINDLDNEMGCFQNSKLNTKIVRELLQKLSVTNSFVK